MLTFESIGLLDNVGYARLLTERFEFFVDGQSAGCKDLWYDGKIFACNPPHKTYYINCPQEMIPLLQERWDVKEDEPYDYCVAYDITDIDLIDIVRFIRFYEKKRVV